MSDQYLFPVRQNRRDFLKAAAVGAAAFGGVSSWSSLPGAENDSKPVVIGEGKHRYTLDPTCAAAPQKGSFSALRCPLTTISKYDRCAGCGAIGGHDW